MRSAVEVVGVGELDLLADLDAVFTGAELADVERRPDPRPALAARLAAKRAVVVAAGDASIDPRDVEIRRGGAGQPMVRLHDTAAASLGECVIHLSLSHEGDNAAAVVMIERPAS
jgi:holo-[acyl-carrier protein] synthase